ncbi:MAG TPA: N-acetyltransferase family protein [Panacibacter sp.]|nr:N-acetyltransferase family protein [Panacibacter sp.]HNP45677.1 N-acetyltransferase family protein [Panacibacter sp.]
MIEVRPAIEKDLQQILDIYNDAIVNTTAVFQYDVHTIEMRREWFAQKQKDRYPVFVAEEGDAVVGFSTFGPFRNWPGYKYTVEHSIYVKNGHRRKGIGSILMRPLIDNARALRYHTIIAGIDADNTASIEFHRQFGFEQVAYFKEVGWKFGRWLNLVFMQFIV